MGLSNSTLTYPPAGLQAHRAPDRDFNRWRSNYTYFLDELRRHHISAYKRGMEVLVRLRRSDPLFTVVDIAIFWHERKFHALDVELTEFLELSEEQQFQVFVRERRWAA